MRKSSPKNDSQPLDSPIKAESRGPFLVLEYCVLLKTGLISGASTRKTGIRRPFYLCSLDALNSYFSFEKVVVLITAL